MDTKVAIGPPGRPGKPSFRASARPPGKDDPPDTMPGNSEPPSVGVGALDNVRSAFWQAYHHLFPPHSLAAQTSNGSLVISWSIADDPHAKYPYAAPVMLRFDEALIDTMWKADTRQRLRIAQNHEPTLREGLRGYDPFTRFPNARVINIG